MPAFNNEAVTIDKLNIGVYVQYARRMQFMESVNKQYRIAEAYNIPAQTQIINISPRTSEIEMLMGRSYGGNVWAIFSPPRNYFIQHRPIVSKFRIVPSIGSLQKQDADQAKVAAYSCATRQEEREQQAIGSVFEVVNNICGWIGHIVGRVGQFLQG